ncbi:MAG: hypothetical protein J6J03_08585 [Tyzzerella sp.]|nr:hypothetical protein [Tyzzerella sp.]
MFSWLDSYDIYDEAGNTVYNVQGQLAFNWMATYVIGVWDSQDALSALMLVLAIVAEKCSRN